MTYGPRTRVADVMRKTAGNLGMDGSAKFPSSETRSLDSPAASQRLVILESPYAGPTAAAVEANLAYARRALRDSLDRGEAPIASHLLYPQVLEDRDPDQRARGIAAGLAWLKVAEATVVYADRGITPGMQYGINQAHAAGLPVEYRYIEGGG